MIDGIHIILTYKCNLECDHCFCYCSPISEGTFTINQIKEILIQSKKTGTVEEIFFEGGEPFLYFPLLAEGIKQASKMGFKVGIVTNAYGANSREDAKLWIKPLADAGLSYMHISNDEFHYEDKLENPATIAYSVAQEFGIDALCITIEKPQIVSSSINDSNRKGHPIIEGGARLRGRAVEKLAKDLPLTRWTDFNECPYEDLKDPSRVHVDPYGNVHLCQGISMGNIWKKPLYELIKDYNAEKHPICGPLIRGGPAELAKELNINPEDEYVDECHMCFLVRREIMERYPEYLAPKQVYGIDD